MTGQAGSVRRRGADRPGLVGIVRDAVVAVVAVVLLEATVGDTA